MKRLARWLLSVVSAANSILAVNDRLRGSPNDRDTDDTDATFAGYRRGLILSSWRSARPGAAPDKGERHMLRMIVAAAVVVVITSTSAIAGIVLTQAAFARTSALNSGTLVDESQSFRMVAKAPVTFDW
jgi:hypothetical protein